MSSSGEVKLVVSSLRAEANKWRTIGGKMETVKNDTSRLSLLPSAFFFADIVSVAGHSSSYNTFHDWTVKLFSDAKTEFDQIGGALDKNTDEYERTDYQSAAALSGAVIDLSTIYGTQPPSDK